MQVCRTNTASNHPHLRDLPVTVPFSLPTVAKCSPISSNNSQAKGPSPTRVVYAFTIPKTNPIAFGPNPVPVAAIPDNVFDDVTYG